MKKEGYFLKKKELEELYEKIPEDKKNQAKILLDEISFMLSTAKKLKTKIRKNGPVEDFEQGSQKFQRESPALKAYNQTMKSLDTYLKNFLSLVPDEEMPPEDDDFDEFFKQH